MSTLSAFDSNNFSTIWAAAPNPAPGVYLSIAAPVNAMSELLALSLIFQTDGNAANRYIEVYLAGTGVSIILGSSEFAQTAGKQRLYLISSMGFSSVADSGWSICIGIPKVPVILEGHSIAIRITNGQATDQITGAHYIFKVWTYEQ